MHFDLAHFIYHFLWYLLAFVVGSFIAWLIARATVKRTSREEAIRDLPGSREIQIGSRR